MVPFRSMRDRFFPSIKYGRQDPSTEPQADSGFGSAASDEPLLPNPGSGSNLEESSAPRLSKAKSMNFAGMLNSLTQSVRWPASLLRTLEDDEFSSPLQSPRYPRYETPKKHRSLGNRLSSSRSRSGRKLTWSSKKSRGAIPFPQAESPLHQKTKSTYDPAAPLEQNKLPEISTDGSKAEQAPSASENINALPTIPQLDIGPQILWPQQTSIQEASNDDPYVDTPETAVVTEAIYPPTSSLKTTIEKAVPISKNKSTHIDPKLNMGSAGSKTSPPSAENHPKPTSQDKSRTSREGKLDGPPEEDSKLSSQNHSTLLSENESKASDIDSNVAPPQNIANMLEHIERKKRIERWMYNRGGPIDHRRLLPSYASYEECKKILAEAFRPRSRTSSISSEAVPDPVGSDFEFVEADEDFARASEDFAKRDKDPVKESAARNDEDDPAGKDKDSANAKVNSAEADKSFARTNEKSTGADERFARAHKASIEDFQTEDRQGTPSKPGKKPSTYDTYISLLQNSGPPARDASNRHVSWQAMPIKDPEFLPNVSRAGNVLGSPLGPIRRGWRSPSRTAVGAMERKSGIQFDQGSQVPPVEKRDNLELDRQNKKGILRHTKGNEQDQNRPEGKHAPRSMSNSHNYRSLPDLRAKGPLESSPEQKLADFTLSLSTHSSDIKTGSAPNAAKIAADIARETAHSLALQLREIKSPCMTKKSEKASTLVEQDDKRRKEEEAAERRAREFQQAREQTLRRTADEKEEQEREADLRYERRMNSRTMGSQFWKPPSIDERQISEAISQEVPRFREPPPIDEQQIREAIYQEVPSSPHPEPQSPFMRQYDPDVTAGTERVPQSSELTSIPSTVSNEGLPEPYASAIAIERAWNSYLRREVQQYHARVMNGQPSVGPAPSTEARPSLPTLPNFIERPQDPVPTSEMLRNPELPNGHSPYGLGSSVRPAQPAPNRSPNGAERAQSAIPTSETSSRPGLTNGGGRPVRSQNGTTIRLTPSQELPNGIDEETATTRIRSAGQETLTFWD